MPFKLVLLSSLRSVLCLAMVVATTFGQANLATVTGAVSDAAELVIPGAVVSIRNVDTNIQRQVQTNRVGLYTITNLPPGNYVLTAESPGFRKFVKTGIVLQVGQTLRTDVRLELGQVNEQVTVEASLVTVNTETGTIKGDVIVQEEVQELPLNGRDFTDLAFFVPGVVPKAEGGQGSALNINGARATNTNFYVDGFDNRNARGAAAQVRPNIDALQEFKMEVSGYSAEYGRMAGGILNMVLRSGTNQFHGNLNYFLRNDILDARGFFETDKNKLRQNQFAATVAGPIKKNKTFFLVSYEGQRRIQDQTRLTRVPTLVERQGDFSESLDLNGGKLFLRDRLANGPCNAKKHNSCFPGNIIPASRMDPVGINILNQYPLPNRDPGASGFNYLVQSPDEDDWDSILGKIDHRMGDNSLSFRYQKRFNNTQNPFAGGDANLLGQYGAINNDDRSLGGIDYTRVFSPTFLMEFRGGFSRNSAYNRGPFAGQNIAGELGVPQLIPEGDAKEIPELLDWPRFQVTNHAQLGTGANQPVQYHVTDIQGGIKFTWVKNRHVLKGGYNINRVQFNQPYFNNQRGTYNFRGRRTGHPVADLELGWIHNVTRQVGFNRNYWRQTAMGVFINDDWKATRTLTLNLGLRWEVNEAPYDRYDRLGNYVPEIRKLVISSDRNAPTNFQQLLDETKLRDVVTTAEAEGFPRAIVQTDWINFSPRVGFAWRVFGSDTTVLRGGYGIFMAGSILNNLRNNLSNQFPFAITENFPGVNNDPSLVSLKNPFSEKRRRLSGTTSTRGYNREPKQAYLQSWNLTVERELFLGTAIEMDYRGSKGTHLLRRYDLNQPLRTLDAFIAGEGFARPIPEWNAIQFFGTGSTSIYNAFNVSWRKRSRNGAFFRLNYSYSKSIDDASQVNGASDGGFNGALDSRNLALERARSDWDRGHVFTAVGSYQLPFGRGRQWGNGWRGFTDGLLGGWELSGTATAYSGNPFTVITSNADLNLGESQRPNRLGNGRLEADAFAGEKGADFPWYDVGAFEEVPCYVENPADVPSGCAVSQHGFSPFAFGNSGRNILDGPGLFAINVAMSKNFYIGEGQRLQFRVETFNILNRTNFLLTDEVRQFNAITAGYINRVGNVGRGGGPRVFQYAIKYRF